MAQVTFLETPDFFVEQDVMKTPMPLMHHHNSFELYYIIRGEREYFIGDEFYQLCDGDMVLIPRTLLHRTAGKGASRFLVYFSLAFLERFFTQETVETLCLEKTLVFRPDESRREQISRDFNALYTAFQKGENGALSAGFLYQILFTMTHTQNAFVPKDYSDGRIGQIVRYINENYGKIEDIGQIADRFFVSKYHLCRSFNKSLGLSLVSYLNTIKVRAACALMQNERLTMTEIASRCGFNSSSYFCKVFKNEKGLSPSAYRKELMTK